MKPSHYQRARSRDAFYDYRRCIVCGREHDAAHLALAQREVHAVACSSECGHVAYLARFACCHRAEILNCVCVCATRCPVHGDRHCGSHD